MDKMYNGKGENEKIVKEPRKEEVCTCEKKGRSGSIISVQGDQSNRISINVCLSDTGSDVSDGSVTLSTIGKDKDQQHYKKKRVKGRSERFLRGTCLVCWNIRFIICFIFSALVIFSNVPNFFIYNTYSHGVIENNGLRIAIASVKFVKKFSMELMMNVESVTESVEYFIGKTMIKKGVKIQNYTTNHMYFHDIFLPHVLYNDVTSVLFGFNCGDAVAMTTVLDSNHVKHYAKMITEYVDGKRYIAQYILNKSNDYSELGWKLFKQFRQNEYCACDLKWFSMPSDTIKWNIFVTKTNAPIIHTYKTIFDSEGKMVGKIAVALRINDLSEIMKNTNEMSFLLVDNGKLAASSTYADDEKDVRIYHCHEYPNIIIQSACLYLLSVSNHNYSLIEPTTEKEYFHTFYVKKKKFIMKVEKFIVAEMEFIVVLLIDYHHLFFSINQSRNISYVFSSVFLLLSVLLALFSGNVVSGFMRKIEKNMERLSKLDFEFCIEKRFYKLKEINNVERSFRLLKNGLFNFTKFLPKNVLKRLIHRNKELALGLKNRVGTVLFSDVVGFTTLTENLQPQELVMILQFFFVTSERIISQHGGFVDKYVDCVMGLFFAEHHAINCIRAILNIYEELKKSEFSEKLKLRSGINSGKMLVGFIGSDNKVSYTALGDTVNIAARLEPLNKVYRTQILVGESTYNLTNDEYEYEFVERAKLKGKEEESNIYNLIGKKNSTEQRNESIGRKLYRRISHFSIMMKKPECKK